MSDEQQYDKTQHDYCLEKRDDCTQFLGPCPECSHEHRSNADELFLTDEE